MMEVMTITETKNGTKLHLGSTYSVATDDSASSMHPSLWLAALKWSFAAESQIIIQ